MKFDKESDVTIVLTSCKRFKLLKKTLESIDRFNTYSVREVIITEDSGDERVWEAIPQHWKDFTRVIINEPKLGQIKSIDLAYSFVNTPYIFHCEDDWNFYRINFIEESKRVLENNSKILQVWLRNFQNDVHKRYPFHYLGDKYSLDDFSYFILGSNDDTWKGFSFNPGLRRKKDYMIIQPYYRNIDSSITEANISKQYHQMGMSAAILENSAVEHMGWGHHIKTSEDFKLLKIKNKIKIRYSLYGFLLGIISFGIFEYFLNWIN